MWKTGLITVMLSLICVVGVHSNAMAASNGQSLRVVTDRYCGFVKKIVSRVITGKACQRTSQLPLANIQLMLNQHSHGLSSGVINKALAVMQCSNKHQGENSDILTIIDFSQPSSNKRLWVFNLSNGQLLFNTYVSHGIKSGVKQPKYFSNIVNSKASSIGVYRTENSYYGRYGLALKLAGLDKGFNDNAYRRFIVMHGSWYVNEKFIKKYGRAGRSWGCPSMPLNLTKPIINTIKDNNTLVIYYPGEKWLGKSRFLNCNQINLQHAGNIKKPVVKEKEGRGDIVFVDSNKNNKRDINEPIVAISAHGYQQVFHQAAPLKRMLRRQINNKEFIALNNHEFKIIASKGKQFSGTYQASDPKSTYFVIPVVKKKRGYYATEMHIINLGKVKHVTLDARSGRIEDAQAQSHQVSFERKPAIKIKSTQRFIRWLGL